MRIGALTLLVIAGCGGSPEASLGGSTEKPMNQDALTTPAETTPRLAFYMRKPAADGQIPPPPVLLRLSGTLQMKNGCIILSNGDGDHVLAFEEGTASFDAARQVLTAGGMDIGIGESISVGGPFNLPDDDFDRSAVVESCGVRNVWLVTGTDVKSRP